MNELRGRLQAIWYIIRGYAVMYNVRLDMGGLQSNKPTRNFLIGGDSLIDLRALPKDSVIK